MLYRFEAVVKELYVCEVEADSLKEAAEKASGNFDLCCQLGFDNICVIEDCEGDENEVCILDTDGNIQNKELYDSIEFKTIYGKKLVDD